MTVGIFVGAVAERDHAVDYAGEVGLLAFKTAEQRLRVVGDIALPVGGRANEEGAATPKDAGVEAVHHPNRRLMASHLQRLLHLLGHHLGRAGHGTHQDRDVAAHVCVPTQALLYVRLRKYNAFTVSRKRDIVHVEVNETAETSAAAISAGADPGSQSDYLRLLGERVRQMRARRGMTRKIRSEEHTSELQSLRH